MSHSCAEVPHILRTPYVLVAGGALVGKSRLCQGIIGLEEPPTDTCTSWTIRTKYYTAKVELREEHEDSVDTNITSSPPEALILVFNLAAPSTFEWVQSFIGRPGLETVEVKLLCGTHADALLTSDKNSDDLEAGLLPESFQNAADWSIQNGFEFIICCPMFPALDAVLAIDGSRQGIARVVEALHAHSWPNLDMVQPGPRGPCNGATHEARYDASRPVDDATTKALGHFLCLQARNASERRGSKHFGLHQQLGDEEQYEDGQQNECDAQASHAERVLDGLESLMEEMNGHKSRLATLSDDERREQAASLALRMLKVLEFGNEDSSSDED
ncbi:hypothetical protein Vretimale_7989 [Volvox reticuliferus]|uniref:Uncharacterized protein n=1 Tax=Volvox reticuliferus TaxID=1737510 RepID=A0A8J4CB92_9CHLO|nr:hypothetical protein Vretifemale_5119 [Volvox reticuliferus]GIM03174.1 hypothetical protein Vretimale_7989 [Volvox reticuliferus]